MHVQNLDTRVHKYLLQDKLHIPMTSSVVQQLLHMEGIEFINPKFKHDGKLILPRDIVSQLK